MPHQKNQETCWWLGHRFFNRTGWGIKNRQAIQRPLVINIVDLRHETNNTFRKPLSAPFFLLPPPQNTFSDGRSQDSHRRVQAGSIRRARCAHRAFRELPTRDACKRSMHRRMRRAIMRPGLCSSRTTISPTNHERSPASVHASGRGLRLPSLLNDLMGDALTAPWEEVIDRLGRKMP